MLFIFCLIFILLIIRLANRIVNLMDIKIPLLFLVNYNLFIQYQSFYFHLITKLLLTKEY